MEVARAQLLKLSAQLNQIQEFSGVDVDDKSNKLNFDLAAAVYEWARGTSFEQITGMTTMEEVGHARDITNRYPRPDLYPYLRVQSCNRRDVICVRTTL